MLETPYAEDVTDRNTFKSIALPSSLVSNNTHYSAKLVPQFILLLLKLSF